MMNKIKSLFNDKKYLPICATVAYFFVHLFLLSKHELWRDEAQAYLLVKNTSFVELFKILRIEGHPIGWFLYIYPFAKLGFSFYHFGFISLITMCIGVYFFVKKSPFPFWLTILLLFSNAFLYYNAAISRVYCLCVVFTVAVCCLYEERYEKPILYLFFVSLILQTHIKMSGLAIGFSIDFFIGALNGNKRKIKYLLIPLVSLFLVVAELLPYGEYRPFVVIDDQMNSLFTDILFKAKRGVKRIFEIQFGNDNGRFIILISVILFIIVSYIFYRILKNKKISKYIGISLIVMCGFGAYYIITAFIYGLHRQMSSMLTIMVIAFSWLVEYQEDNHIKWASRIILILFVALSTPLLFKDTMDDVHSVYSYGEITSKYICDNLEKDSTILLTHDPLNPLIISLVDSERKDIVFYDLNHNREYTIHLLNEIFDEMEPKNIVNKAKSLNSKNVYYVCRRMIDDSNLQLIYSNLDKSTIGSEEHFSIYKIK